LIVNNFPQPLQRERDVILARRRTKVEKRAKADRSNRVLLFVGEP
jgi:hypothetical protein